MSAQGWFEVCSGAFKDLETSTAAGRRSRIDSYATASDAEFFAVLSGYFFERERTVLHEYPDVYRLFTDEKPSGFQKCNDRERRW